MGISIYDGMLKGPVLCRYLLLVCVHDCNGCVISG